MTRRKTGIGRRNPSEFGTVEQRPNGRFRAYFRAEGVAHRAPSTFATRADARAWLGKQEAALRGGTFIAPTAGAGTLEEFARAWLASRTDIAPKTRENYSRVLSRWILPTLGHLRLDQITPAKVRSWRADALAAAAADAAGDVRKGGTHAARAWAAAAGLPIAGTGRIPADVLQAWQDAGSPIPTKRRRQGDGSAAVAESYRALKTILGAAERDDLITKNPCRIPGASVVRAAERTPPTPAEVERIAAEMPAHVAAIVVLAAWTGLRSGELRALQRGDVTFTERGAVLAVRRAVQELTGQARTLGALKTRTSRRNVAVPKFAAEVLREHIAAHVRTAESALIFGLPGGGVMGRSQLGVQFRAACRRAGLGAAGFHFHDLRHAAASAAFRAGASVVDVQERLGHATPAMALHYGHATEDADHALAARLDAMFAPNTTAAGELKVNVP